MEGCCCPAGTVTRMELEGLVRQEERRMKGLPSILDESDASPSFVDPYKQPSPMVYPKAVVEQIKSETPDSPPKVPVYRKLISHSNKDADYDVTALSTIPETNREPSTAEPVLSLQHTSPKSPPKASKLPVKSRKHSLQDDATTPIPANTKAWPLLKYLGQKWYMVPPGKSEDRNSVTDSVKSGGPDASSRPHANSQDAEPVKDTNTETGQGHSLDEDRRYASPVVSKHAVHGLAHDSVVPIDGNHGQPKDHFLESDNPTTHVSADTSHHLESDLTHEGSRSTPKHELIEDVLFHSHSGAQPTSHSLDEDASSRAQAHQQSHRLSADGTWATQPHSTPHTLEDETTRASSNK